MPHLRALVERYEGRPFAIVGVNTGDDEETFHKGVETYEMSWISAYQGRSTPIADLYRVDGYPTVLVLDHEGKIHYRNYGIEEPESERLLDELVAAAEKAAER